MPYLHPNWFMRDVERISEESHRRHAPPEFGPQSEHQFYLPRLDYGRRRGPLVGDFWTPNEMRRLFDPPAAFGW